MHHSNNKRDDDQNYQNLYYPFLTLHLGSPLLVWISYHLHIVF